MLKFIWQITHSIIIEQMDLISDNQRKVYMHVVFDIAYHILQMKPYSSIKTLKFFYSPNTQIGSGCQPSIQLVPESLLGSTQAGTWS